MAEAMQPLEVIACVCRTGTYKDPRDPRGTRAGITFADICGALGSIRDPLAADAALMVATRETTKLEAIHAWLRGWLADEMTIEGIEVRHVLIHKTVDNAMADAMLGAKRVGGSKYYRWVHGYLMSKAEEAASMAIRSLR